MNIMVVGTVELMDDDILDGTYDISEQNDLENGDYGE